MKSKVRMKQLYPFSALLRMQAYLTLLKSTIPSFDLFLQKTYEKFSEKNELKIIHKSIISILRIDKKSNHEGKISPVLQNTPPGTPGVSKNPQKYFTNKSVGVFSMNFTQLEITLKNMKFV